jgi:cytochrome c-type biogenesis protein CcmE
MHKYGKFAVLMAIIVGSLLWLATAGIQSSQTYYKTITELHQMGDGAQNRHVRVGGDVQGKSIVHEGTLVKFNLVQDKEILRVAYEGRDPLPDTFRDGAQALADGRRDSGQVRFEICSQAGHGARRPAAQNRARRDSYAFQPLKATTHRSRVNRYGKPGRAGSSAGVLHFPLCDRRQRCGTS